MFFEGWSFMEALYITVITLTTVGYKEVRELDTSGQLWTMALLNRSRYAVLCGGLNRGDRGRGGGRGLL